MTERLSDEQLDAWQGMCEERDRRLKRLPAGGNDTELDYVERRLADAAPALIAEVRRLRELVPAAFKEAANGTYDAGMSKDYADERWECSAARAALHNTNGN